MIRFSIRLFRVLAHGENLINGEGLANSNWRPLWDPPFFWCIGW